VIVADTDMGSMSQRGPLYEFEFPSGRRHTLTETKPLTMAIIR
jgi:hypothetical protein